MKRTGSCSLFLALVSTCFNLVHADDLNHGGQQSEDTVSLSGEVFGQVDKSVKASQLSKKRKTDDFDRKCMGLKNESSFADVIATEVNKNLAPKGNVVGADRVFGLGKTEVAEQFSAPSSMPEGAKSTDVALNSTKLCEVAGSNDQANVYNLAIKSYNETIGKTDAASLSIQKKFWYAQMGCLAYAEAGVTSSEKFPPQKPYVGLFQFDAPKGKTGNTATCNDVWNEKAPEGCKVGSSSSPDFVSNQAALGSASQSFNAFCGVQKVLQTFYIQKYGKNKASCVSIAAPPKSSYNHFVPVNSVSKDDFKVMASCVAKALGIPPHQQATESAPRPTQSKDTNSPATSTSTSTPSAPTPSPSTQSAAPNQSHQAARAPVVQSPNEAPANPLQKQATPQNSQQQAPVITQQGLTASLHTDAARARIATLPSSGGGQCASGTRQTLNALFGKPNGFGQESVGGWSGRPAKLYDEAALAKWQTPTLKYKNVGNIRSYQNYDVRSCQPGPGANSAGHLEIYIDGKWYSDFNQGAYSLADPVYGDKYNGAGTTVYRLLPKGQQQ